jgi:hypothetical protein
MYVIAFFSAMIKLKNLYPNEAKHIYLFSFLSAEQNGQTSFLALSLKPNGYSCLFRIR